MKNELVIFGDMRVENDTSRKTRADFSARNRSPCFVQSQLKKVLAHFFDARRPGVLRLRALWHMIEGEEKSYAYDTAARAEPENRNQAKSSSSGCLALLRKVTPPFAP